VIIDSVLGLIVNLIRGLFDLIPVWSPDLGSLNVSFHRVGQAAGILNGYFPIAVLAIGLGIIFAARLIIAAWYLLVWIYEKLPLKAT